MLLEQTAAEEDLSAPGLSMTAGVPARYTPDSANSAWEVFFKFDELFQFLAAHTNAS
jgi:hypothetical protein